MAPPYYLCTTRVKIYTVTIPLSIGSTRSAHPWSSCACTPYLSYPFNSPCSRTPKWVRLYLLQTGLLFSCRIDPPSSQNVSVAPRQQYVVVDPEVKNTYAWHACAKKVPNEKNTNKLNVHQQLHQVQINFPVFTTTTCRIPGMLLHMLYRFALNISPSWKRCVSVFFTSNCFSTRRDSTHPESALIKRCVGLKRLGDGHRRKGSTRSERRKRKHGLGW